MIEIESVKPHRKLDHFFDLQKNGWLGSDVAHSIRLNDKKVLWLFGDTFVGVRKQNCRGNNWVFLNNTIGIMKFKNSIPLEMNYYWGGNSSQPESFFLSQDHLPGDFLWPTNGIIISDVLIIFCMAVNKTDDQSIDIAGTVCIKIENYLDDPMEWNFDMWDFKFDIGIPHAALYLDNKYMYSFLTNRNFFKDGIFLGRLKKLFFKTNGDVSGMKFFNGKSWIEKFSNAQECFYPSCTESNIYFDKKTNLFFTTTYRPQDNEILLTWAERITGPWNRPIKIFEIPESNKPFKVHSYAMRIHGWLSDKKEKLIISYATNEFGGMDNLMTPDGMDVYRPKFVEVKLK